MFSFSWSSDQSIYSNSLGPLVRFLSDISVFSPAQMDQNKHENAAGPYCKLAKQASPVQKPQKPILTAVLTSSQHYTY